MKNLAKERIGQIRKNNFGSLMEIVDYKDNKNIFVRFLETDNIVPAQYNNFINGQVSNPLDRTVCNIGFIGEGKYRPSLNNRDGAQYSTWYSMMQRCYGGIHYKDKFNTYQDCVICEEWHCFQNYAKWYDENYYKIDNERMNLDKDILFKGNKLYSPKTCVFAPHRINTLFVKTDSKRGALPIGVTYHNKNGNYMARESNCNYIGSYKNIEDAFNAYKIHKEKIIKQIADEYREKIPYELYNALINYNVEITD